MDGTSSSSSSSSSTAPQPSTFSFNPPSTQSSQSVCSLSSSRVSPEESIWYTKNRDPNIRIYTVWGDSEDMATNTPLPVTPSKQDPNAIVSWTTHEKNSPPQLWYYSGVPAIASGSGQLSLFHRLHDRGTFSHDTAEIKAIRDYEGGRMPLVALMQPGLASVCVEIPTFSTGPPDRQSGFRLRREGADVVVTCAHFTEWPDNHKDFDEVARSYSRMENGVSRAIMAGEVEKDVHYFNDELKLQLIAVHRPWDIAIFRVIETPEDDGQNPVIDWGQMHFVAQEDRGKLGSKDFWWSVGYNLNNDQDRFHSDWKEFFLRQPLNVQKDITHNHGYDETHPPSLDFLKSCRRTVSFGKLDEFAETGFAPQPHQVSLNLSAWFGRSGSMVCTREKGGVDGEESRVYVYGVVTGGSPQSNYNVMTMFTAEMKEWFEKALAFDPESEEHPGDFNQRFVMAVSDDHDV